MPDSPLRAVFDPNVLISARISPHGTPARLLRAAEEGAFELVVSEQVLEEVEDVLNRQKMRRYLPESDVPVYLDRLRAVSEVAEGAPSGAGCTPDQDDDYLIGLVGFVATRPSDRGAQCVLVSGDRHLLDLPDRIVRNNEGRVLARILPPAEFLEKLRLVGG